MCRIAGNGYELLLFTTNEPAPRGQTLLKAHPFLRSGAGHGPSRGGGGALHAWAVHGGEVEPPACETRCRVRTSPGDTVAAPGLHRRGGKGR